MRKINILQITLFIVLFTIILSLGISATSFLLGWLKLGDFRGIVLVIAGFFITYTFALLIFRLFLYFASLKEGEIELNSRQEFIYHVYLLFHLIIFYPVMRSGAVPLPLMRLFYLGLGAKLGKNTFSSGIILDPIFVEVGDNTLIGQYALIVPHALENERLGHYRIKIGDNVTIGAHAVILAGTTIEDNALVATGAIVKKGSYIAAGEIWGGVPARFIKKS